MCIDIAQILLRTLAAEGVVFTDGMLKTLLVQYIRTAEDMVTRYHADAAINGLTFDRHEEETIVSAFSGGLRLACHRFLDDPLGVPLIPSWNRISSAIPDFLNLLCDAVENDNRTPLVRGTSPS
jgi:glucosyl-3-phosphoglycerate synthase